jgi:GNAT superfamily N-acetyltransferase
MEPPATATVRQAAVCDIDRLGPLFDGSRQFYRQASDPGRIPRSLSDRFGHNRSVIFIGVRGEAAIGLAQLYPSFSLAALAGMDVLNDIFVDPAERRAGAGAGLLKAATDYARRVGAIRVAPSTGLTNPTADRRTRNQVGSGITISAPIRST